jgi:hypothetical protein
MAKSHYGMYFERHKLEQIHHENILILLTTITVSKNPKTKLDSMQKHEQI